MNRIRMYTMRIPTSFFYLAKNLQPCGYSAEKKPVNSYATSGKLIWEYYPGVANGMAPDLRASPFPLDKATFDAVVRRRARMSLGMPSLPDLTDEHLPALMHYARQRARATIPMTSAEIGN